MKITFWDALAAASGFVDVVAVLGAIAIGYLLAIALGAL